MQGMNAWLDAYDLAIETIADHNCPRLHAAENTRVNEELFQLAFKTKSGRKYRLVYLIENQTVFVLRVLGPGQRLLTRKDLPRD